MKIQKPFKYMGSKGRFYKEIKEIFKKNKRFNYIDIFAGGMEVALNLKEDFPEINVNANVVDKHIESFLKIKKTSIESYLKLIDYLYEDSIKVNSRNIYDNDKERWNNMKIKYRIFWVENNLKFGEEEKNMIELLVSLNKGKSLSGSFYSEEKIKKIKVYLNKLKNIKVSHKLFNERWSYRDSFILLDPPYLAGTEVDKIGKKGYNYSGIWKENDDMRLVSFIKNNLNKNNVFLIFGSLENNLSKLLQKEFNGVNFVVKKYKKSIFGISQERAEWYCLIK